MGSVPELEELVPREEHARRLQRILPGIIRDDNRLREWFRSCFCRSVCCRLRFRVLCDGAVAREEPSPGEDDYCEGRRCCARGRRDAIYCLRDYCENSPEEEAP